MSDRYSRLLAEYAYAIKWDDLDNDVIHEVKRRILDSIGVAMAAYHGDAVRAVRRYAYHWRLDDGSIIFGTTFNTTPEVAGFVNGVMVRYLDFNDTYLSLEPLHPSDMIPALLALAQYIDAPPDDLITAIAIGYEIGVTLCDAASLRKHRWDHVNYIGIATAAAASKLLGLTPSEIEHAISIAIVPHASMRQTRAGELSMWKGAAAANSARNGLFGSLLAAQGMTGPYQPFEGEMGLFKQLLNGERFIDEVLKPLEEKKPPRRILDTYIKFWPVEYHAQSAVDAALQIYREAGGIKPEDIEKIHIDTFKASYEIIAKDPEKWEPKTRETADHSLPYITVAALLDGEVTQKTFSKERIFDPVLRKILKEQTTLKEDEELTKGYPDGIPNRIIVKLKDGREFIKEVKYPRGHAKNPMTDDELIDKVRACLSVVNMDDRTDDIANLVFSLEHIIGWEDLFELIIV